MRVQHKETREAHEAATARLHAMHADATEKTGKLRAGANGEAAFYEAKLDVGRFFMARVLPRHSTHFQGIMAGGETLTRMKAEAF